MSTVTCAIAPVRCGAREGRLTLWSRSRRSYGFDDSRILETIRATARPERRFNPCSRPPSDEALGKLDDSTDGTAAAASAAGLRERLERLGQAGSPRTIGGIHIAEAQHVKDRVGHVAPHQPDRTAALIDKSHLN